MIILTIMLVAILEVLDSTIVNVALPNMMPSLGADQDQITWVLTSYVVAAAMMLPLTGFLSARFGIKNLLIIDVTGFMISSFFCGLANSLDLMVFLRLCQGAFGAALIPLSQSILRESFPLAQQGKAMAIWGLGIMAAPVFGPVLGGFITEHATWRWIFYLNAPICFFALMMILAIIPVYAKEKRRLDYTGAFFMFIGIGCLQIFLDRGNSKGWFQSDFIVLMGMISLFGMILFLYRTATNATPVIKLSILKNRNFTLCTILLAMFCGCLFGFITLQPIMLESLFRYTPMLAGKTMMAIGLSSAIAMITASVLMSHIQVKYILIISLFLASAGIYHESTVSLQASQIDFIVGDAMLGFGLGLFMVPLTTYSLATLAFEDVTEAAGLFAYGRMLGTSIGISLFSTFVSRKAQFNWSQLSAKINIFNPHLHTWLQQQNLTLNNPKALAELQSALSTHSSMIAFIDVYKLISIILICLLPLVLFLKNVILTETKTVTH